MNLWVVIYTYDKIKEACIQMELIRNLRSKYFSEIVIVHTYNWNRDDYKEKYLEDELIYMENPWHYEWAANMMDTWVEALLKYQDLDYFIINASDIWWIKPESLVKIINDMEKSSCVLWTCPWSFPWQDNRRWVWLACDTFILNAKREGKNHIFPLKWKEFHDKYIDFIRYMWKNNVLVEWLFASRYISACSNIKRKSDSELGLYANNHLYIIKERMPTLLSVSERNFDVPDLWLYTNHDINIKKQVLINNNIIPGPYAKDFVS